MCDTTFNNFRKCEIYIPAHFGNASLCMQCDTEFYQSGGLKDYLMRHVSCWVPLKNTFLDVTGNIL